MKQVEKDGFVLWEAWVDQNNLEADWIRGLQDRASVIEQRLANLEGQTPGFNRKYIDPERYNRAMMLLRELLETRADYGGQGALEDFVNELREKIRAFLGE